MSTAVSFRFVTVITLAVMVSLAPPVHADRGDELIAVIDARYQAHKAIALELWDLSELGYLETKSSGLLQRELEEHGFTVTAGVAGIPTAFVAEAGEGGPVIALLAEFDALPGITQTASPVREEIPGKSAGQACGHHLFGTASVGAAIALKGWLEDNEIAGTIRVYGTPAEEGGAGKAYMVRAGLFEDADLVLSWHPGDVNRAEAARSNSNRSARFNFHGISSHAAVAPEKGRSALDGVEAFNFMMNLMREHVPQETRIHYVITAGGEAPNVVPDYAQVYYYVRHPSADMLLDIWQQVEAAAQAAASGTGTTVEWEIMHGSHSLLPNPVIAERMQASLEALGGIEWDAEEQAFAQKIHETLDRPEFELGTEQEVLPIHSAQGMGSTDVGDVSWNVPTAEFSTATWVPGTPPHSWQAIAAGGTTIGIKGMQLAAKTLALTAADFFERPQLVERARRVFEEQRGEDYVYRPLIGDREPPLDYRVSQRP